CPGFTPPGVPGANGLDDGGGRTLGVRWPVPFPIGLPLPPFGGGVMYGDFGGMLVPTGALPLPPFGGGGMDRDFAGTEFRTGALPMPPFGGGVMYGDFGGTELPGG